MSAPATDRFAAARAVADAVLYEGYVLYPYRASARKNQLRWQFGVLTPRAVVEADPSERWSMRTECLMQPGAAPALTVRIRCLQVQHRAIEAATGDGPATFSPTERLDADGAVWVPWDEAVEHEVDLGTIDVLTPGGTDRELAFRLPGGEETEVLRDESGTVIGRAVRHRDAVEGLIRVSTRWAAGNDARLKVTVTVENVTDWRMPGTSRDEIVRRSLVAVHTLLAVDDGAFVSLLDPPQEARHAVASCRSDGTFPVLVGDEGATDVVLSSPIILYDHPAIAPESQGDLYDATEIDEILALRVLTLTDDEKAEARGTDTRAAAIVDRCDDMPPEVWARLHGAVRSLSPAGSDPPAAESGPADTLPSAGPAAVAVPGTEADEPPPWWDPGMDASVDPWSDSVWVGGVEVAKGSAVRLRPSRRADAHDLFLAGLTATVAGVFRDVDGNDHVAVTVDDDPATEAFEWQRRYLFFHPDEVEPLSDAEADR